MLESNYFDPAVSTNGDGDVSTVLAIVIPDYAYTDGNEPLPEGAANDSAISPEELVHGACHYWDRPLGWIALLACNFAIMFLVPLIVSTEMHIFLKEIGIVLLKS